MAGHKYLLCRASGRQLAASGSSAARMKCIQKENQKYKIDFQGNIFTRTYINYDFLCYARSQRIKFYVREIHQNQNVLKIAKKNFLQKLTDNGVSDLSASKA